MTVLPTLHKRRHALADGRAQVARLEQLPIPRSFPAALGGAGLWPLRATAIGTLQVNLGKKCNQTCRHCHVDAGPDRTEVMPTAVLDACLAVLAAHDIPTLDITGGAPELHPEFRRVVTTARGLGRRVIDRCNLTITRLPNYRYLPAFLAEHGVEIIASLPCYQQGNTDAQRGDGVYQDSIAALKELNALGYGRPGTGLVLHLVTNPLGPSLPPAQEKAEPEWRAQLEREHGIQFNRLLNLTNMPISRFLESLEEDGRTEAYLEKLAAAFNPVAAAGVMCRTLLSVGWDGRLYDCDFNQQLDLPVEPRVPGTIFEYQAAALAGREIVVAPHCYGCTAGAGSSCGGALDG